MGPDGWYGAPMGTRDTRREKRHASEADRLEPKGHRSGSRVSPVPGHGHRTLPADRAPLTRSCQACGTWEARIGPCARQGRKPYGHLRARRVWGWAKAQAVPSRGGDGWSPPPARKRADFPAVSRDENHGSIEGAGVAHVGGSVPRVRPSPVRASTAGPSRAASRW
jgi:hypothetical protein